jgi:hypothetical protein
MIVDWNMSTDVLGKRRWEAQVMSAPNVYLRVTPGPEGVEGLIYAVFRWVKLPQRKPQPCPLDRFVVPLGLGTDLVSVAKAECIRKWEEEHGAVEKKLLRRMWAKRVAANFELLEFRMEDRAQRNATLESALVQERLAERKQERAQLGVEVEEVEKPS